MRRKPVGHEFTTYPAAEKDAGRQPGVYRFYRFDLRADETINPDHAQRCGIEQRLERRLRHHVRIQL